MLYIMLGYANIFIIPSNRFFISINHAVFAQTYQCCRIGNVKTISGAVDDLHQAIGNLARAKCNNTHNHLIQYVLQCSRCTKPLFVRCVCLTRHMRTNPHTMLVHVSICFIVCMYFRTVKYLHQQRNEVREKSRMFQPIATEQIE